MVTFCQDVESMPFELGLLSPPVVYRWVEVRVDREMRIFPEPLERGDWVREDIRQRIDNLI